MFVYVDVCNNLTILSHFKTVKLKYSNYLYTVKYTLYKLHHLRRSKQESFYSNSPSELLQLDSIHIKLTLDIPPTLIDSAKPKHSKILLTVLSAIFLFDHKTSFRPNSRLLRYITASCLITALSQV